MLSRQVTHLRQKMVGMLRHFLRCFWVAGAQVGQVELKKQGLSMTSCESSLDLGSPLQPSDGAIEENEQQDNKKLKVGDV